MNKIVLCECCLGAQADTLPAQLRDSIRAAGLGRGFDVATSQDLCAGRAPVTMVLQGPDRASYVFDGVKLADGLDDIIATCRCYLAAPKGWITDARPCGQLRYRLRARVPAA